MGKLLLVSILIATVAYPARAASEPNPNRGFKSLLVYLCLVDVAYVFTVAVLYPRL